MHPHGRELGGAVQSAQSPAGVAAGDVSPQELTGDPVGGTLQPQAVPASSSPFAAANVRLAERQHETETDGDDDEPLVEDTGRIQVQAMLQHPLVTVAKPGAVNGALAETIVSLSSAYLSAPSASSTRCVSLSSSCMHALLANSAQQPFGTFAGRHGRSGRCRCWRRRSWTRSKSPSCRLHSRSTRYNHALLLVPGLASVSRGQCAACLC